MDQPGLQELHIIVRLKTKHSNKKLKYFIYFSISPDDIYSWKSWEDKEVEIIFISRWPLRALKRSAVAWSALSPLVLLSQWRRRSWGSCWLTSWSSTPTWCPTARSSSRGSRPSFTTSRLSVNFPATEQSASLPTWV